MPGASGPLATWSRCGYAEIISGITWGERLRSSREAGEVLLGAIAGDIIGSIYEGHSVTTRDFPLFDPQCRFTDDTVMTAAVADAILTGVDYGTKLREWFHLYPDRGYGPAFRKWASSSSSQQGLSMGNGSAMRVSAVGYAFDTLKRVLQEAEKSALPSHAHVEGIKGAQAVAAAVFLARTGSGKDAIAAYVEEATGYYLRTSLRYLREHQRPWVTCPTSVPQAITAFLRSTDYEDAVRKAVSLAGDTDTVACIAGAIAEAFYGEVPGHIGRQVQGLLDDRIGGLVEAFSGRYREHDGVTIQPVPPPPASAGDPHSGTTGG